MAAEPLLINKYAPKGIEVDWDSAHRWFGALSGEIRDKSDADLFLGWLCLLCG